MRYLVLVYGNEQIWSDPTVDFAAMIGEVDAFNTALRASGEMVAVDGLVPQPHSVRVQGAGPVVSDGPYLEAKEYVGSYFALDVDSEERALEIVRSYPVLAHTSALGGGLEMWPLAAAPAPPVLRRDGRAARAHAAPGQPAGDPHRRLRRSRAARRAGPGRPGTAPRWRRPWPCSPPH